MNPQLHKFITTGERPGSKRELSAVLDSARNLILQTSQTKPKTMITFPTETQKRETLLEKMTAEYRVKNGMPPAPTTAKPAAKARSQASRIDDLANYITQPRKHLSSPAATAKPAVIHRAASKPAAAPVAPSAKLTSAAEFQKPVRTMARSEWNKLSASDKGRWISEGGKLV